MVFSASYVGIDVNIDVSLNKIMTHLRDKLTAVTISINSIANFLGVVDPCVRNLSFDGTHFGILNIGYPCKATICLSERNSPAIWCKTGTQTILDIT